MSRGLPVVARDAGAVPETAGDAALVVAGGDIALAAEAVAEVLTSRRTREGLSVNAMHRLADLRSEVLVPRILDAVDPLVSTCAPHTDWRSGCRATDARRMVASRHTRGSSPRGWQAGWT